MPLRGYKPAGGSSRRYINTRTGKSISRREYDNKRAQAAGFRNRYELEEFRAKIIGGSRWRSWAYDVKQHTGKQPTWEMYGDVKEVRERRQKLREDNPGEFRRGELDQLDPKLVAADGPLANILDASGRRPKDDYGGRPVGNS